MGTFSYAVKWKLMMPPDVRAGGKVYWMGGSFTDAQTGGTSTMALDDDHGVTEVLHFDAVNLTDTDEVVQVAVSAADVTLTVATNDDDGTWEAYVLEY